MCDMVVVVADAMEDVEECVVKNVDVVIISSESEESVNKFDISDRKSGSDLVYDDRLLTSDDSDWCSDNETIQVKKQK